MKWHISDEVRGENPATDVPLEVARLVTEVCAGDEPATGESTLPIDKISSNSNIVRRLWRAVRWRVRRLWRPVRWRVRRLWRAVRWRVRRLWRPGVRRRLRNWKNLLPKLYSLLATLLGARRAFGLSSLFLPREMRRFFRRSRC